MHIMYICAYLSSKRSVPSWSTPLMKASSGLPGKVKVAPPSDDEEPEPVQEPVCGATGDGSNLGYNESIKQVQNWKEKTANPHSAAKVRRDTVTDRIMEMKKG